MSVRQSEQREIPTEFIFWSSLKLVLDLEEFINIQNTALKEKRHSIYWCCYKNTIGVGKYKQKHPSS